MQIAFVWQCGKSYIYLRFLHQCLHRFGSVPDAFLVSGKGGERGKLCGTVLHRHPRMPRRNVMRMVYDALIIRCVWFLVSCCRLILHSCKSFFSLLWGIRWGAACPWHHFVLLLIRGAAHSWWPPICLFRSLAVAPSSKSSALRMMFLPKFFFIFSTASCMRRSLASSRSSSACRRRRAS